MQHSEPSELDWSHYGGIEMTSINNQTFHDVEDKFSSLNTGSVGAVTNCNSKGNVHFLKQLNQGPKEVKENISINVENPLNDHLTDIANMTATALGQKYSQSYSSWKNMKSRCKKGYVLAPEFAVFKSFLAIMEPCPSKEFTLDRVDHENLNYSPDNCRWADKYTQNQNKGNNVHLTYLGKTFTVSVWAKRTNQKPDTLYHRKASGWSDAEIITGKRLSPKLKGSIFPEGHEEYWENAFNESDEDCQLIFFLKILLPKKHSLERQMQEQFNPNGDLTDSEQQLFEDLSSKLDKVNNHICRAKTALGKKHGKVITDLSTIIR